MFKKAVVGIAVVLVAALALVIALRDQFTESTFFIVSGLLGLFTLALVPLAVFLVIGINVFNRDETDR